MTPAHVALFGIVALGSCQAAFAQDCSLTGKSLRYKAEVCLRENCSVVQQRITILGDKALLHFDDTVAEGILFEFGRTIDMATDTVNAPVADGGKLPDGATDSATATAQWSGRDLSFVQRRELTAATGETISVYQQRVEIKLRSCTKCRLDDYVIEGFVQGTSIRSKTGRTACIIEADTATYQR